MLRSPDYRDQSATPRLALVIDRAAGVPVFEQICSAVREKIASGDLPAGAKLPPTRGFALDVGVSRSTMVNAYDQLVAEGYLEARRGSGYTVCAMGAAPSERRKSPRTTIAEDAPAPRLPFSGSTPDMDLFPYRQWANAVSRVCRSRPRAMLADAPLFGNFALRTAVAEHIRDWRGVEAGPDQIVITAGAGEALELVLRTLAGPGDEVAFEDPGYPPLYAQADLLGFRSAPLALDEHGALVPQGAGPVLAVLTPSHQYPVGGAMSAPRRRDFVRWARENRRWIVEDDYDSEFRYAGRPIPALAGFDGLERTLYVASFSKIFSEGLRLGYMVLPQGLVEPFRDAVKKWGTKASYMPQEALADFMTSGEFYRHLRRVRRIYGERRNVLLDGLAAPRFAAFGQFEDYQAGMQIVFHLKPGWNDAVVADAADEVGVKVVPLSRFCVRDKTRNGLVLGFCGFDEARISAGLDILLNVLEGLPG